MSADPHDSRTPPDCACWSRRDSLRAVGAAGVAAVGAVGLAGCGGGGTGTAQSTVTAPASGAVKAADVPVGGGTVIDALKVVVTQPTEGDYKAFSAVCTHQGCLVNSVQDGRIICPCHGSMFDIATGDVVQGPATQPLPEESVTLSGDSLTVG
jgi:nitrite reductase/ring-hydroxylating ferredoxin subunit